MTFVAVVFGSFLVVVGVSHFVIPGYFCSLVPPWMPRPGLIVTATGAIEIVLGAAIVVPSTRSVAAFASAVLIGLYMVSHLDAAARARRTEGSWLRRPVGVVARIVVNIGYIAIATAVAMWG